MCLQPLKSAPDDSLQHSKISPFNCRVILPDGEWKIDSRMEGSFDYFHRIVSFKAGVIKDESRPAGK